MTTDDETTEIDARPPCPLLVPAASDDYQDRIVVARLLRGDGPGPRDRIGLSDLRARTS